MKQKLTVAVTLLITLLAAACGGGTATDGNSSYGQGASGDFKVAMILPGKINDQSWNAAGYAALQAVETQVGAEIAYSEDVNPANQNDAWRDYAARGYDLILSWGGQFEDGAAAVSEEYPNSAFVVIDGVGENGANYASYDMATEQYHFLGGAAAGLVTESNTVGVIGGLCFSNTARAVHGYEQGAEYANSGVRALSVFTGDFEDPAKAKEAALSLVGQGADVLMTNLNAGLQGVIEAAKERDVFVIAEWADLNQLAPEHMLTSVLMDQTVLAVKAAEDVKNGSFKGKRYVQTIQLGDQLNLASFHGLAPQSVHDELTQIQSDIAAGTIEVESNESCS